MFYRFVVLILLLSAPALSAQAHEKSCRYSLSLRQKVVAGVFSLALGINGFYTYRILSDLEDRIVSEPVSSGAVEIAQKTLPTTAPKANLYPAQDWQLAQKDPSGNPLTDQSLSWISENGILQPTREFDEGELIFNNEQKKRRGGK